MFRNTQCLCGVVDVVLHNYVNKLSWPLLTIGTLQVHLAYLQIYCLRLFVIIYKHVMFMVCWWHCHAHIIYIPTFMVTSANLSINNIDCLRLVAMFMVYC